MLVQELWKGVHVRALIFANAVICLTAETRTWLKRGHREVGRLALGCHGRVAVEAIQGDAGWSSFEAQEAKSKIAYEGRLRLLDDARWVRRVFRYVSLKGIRTKWLTRLQTLRRKFGFFANPINEDAKRKWKEAVQRRVQEEETAQWNGTMMQKSTLTMHRSHKKAILAL
ncbi:hypothetical protein HPB50_027184 [Hyalomma asiaticum]|uniref:Uncharacterized protein n=1 Tax=Hyalomma asiaticum TaxID=266040 RepID=A0ACB7TS73_HYAAI|nr:hypothetical protein HPB50_027184 [Hyalomma asiaticum]